MIDNISGRLESTDLVSSMSVFDPRHLPDKLSDYGAEKIKILAEYCGLCARG